MAVLEIYFLEIIAEMFELEDVWFAPVKFVTC